MTTSIILRAFGSSLPQHRAVRALIMEEYQRAFPQCALRMVLASRRVREAEGLADMNTVCQELKSLGTERVVVQHLLLLAGQMRAEAEGETLAVPLQHAAPLLADAADIQWLAAQIHLQCREGCPNLVVVHGNTTNPQYNHTHLQLQEILVRSNAAIRFASLEGEPGPGPMHAIRPAAQAAGCAHIIPVFLFPGGHVQEDLLGSQADSWASQLGVPCTASPTLLEQEAVRARFIARTRQALAAEADVSGS